MKDDASSTPTPEQLEVQLTKLVRAFRTELQLPEIVVVQEVENQQILQELGDRVNAASGTAYTRRPSRRATVAGSRPGSCAGREPIVGEFDIGGRTVRIVGNHFKSKGGDDPLFGVNQAPIRVTEVQRKLHARVVRDFVNTILDADPDALVMVAGDLNDFQFGEPGEGPDHPIAILEGAGGEVPLTNLLGLEKPSETLTFVFDGNSQVLDHMLVSPALLELVRAADTLHFNAGFPAAVGDDPTTAVRAADHDPLEGRFSF